MRATIELDDDLVRDAMKASGAQSVDQVVQKGLRALTEGVQKRNLLDELRELGPWEGDLDEMRRDKPHLRSEW